MDVKEVVQAAIAALLFNHYSNDVWVAALAVVWLLAGFIAWTFVRIGDQRWRRK